MTDTNPHKIEINSIRVSLADLKRIKQETREKLSLAIKEFILSSKVEDYETISPDSVVTRSNDTFERTSPLSDGNLMFLVGLTCIYEPNYDRLYRSSREGMIKYLSTRTSSLSGSVCSNEGMCRLLPRHYSWQCEYHKTTHQTLEREKIRALSCDTFYTAIFPSDITPDPNIHKVFTNALDRDKYVNTYHKSWCHPMEIAQPQSYHKTHEKSKMEVLELQSPIALHSPEQDLFHLLG